MTALKDMLNPPSYICLIEVHCMHINLVPKTIDVLQGDPYSMVVEWFLSTATYYEVAF